MHPDELAQCEVVEDDAAGRAAEIQRQRKKFATQERMMWVLAGVVALSVLYAFETLLRRRDGWRVVGVKGSAAAPPVVRD